MYHLIKTEKLVLDNAISGLMPLYRHTEIDCFKQLFAAQEACKTANKMGESGFCYVLNESGQEYYDGTWID